MATLYRKYRPQTFNQIIGQDHIVDTLRKALKLNRVSHAYLFCGARGVGKTTLARLLAKAVNCLKSSPTGERPCGKCRNCLDIADGRFVDLIEIDAASNRGIDEIRDLRDRVQFAPSVGKKRVYIIDEVHMLTREAFNALLKTLEEPPGHTLFIFATTEVHKVPATILSRCQRFDFRLGTDEVIEKNIKELAKKENLKLTDEVAKLIVRSAAGSYRDAQSILDQLSSHLVKKKIDSKEAIKLLNLSTLEQVDELIAKFKEGNLSRIILYLGDLAEKNVGFSNLTDEVIVELRRRMIDKIISDQDFMWEKNTLEQISRAKKIAQSTPMEQLALELAAVEVCEEAVNNLQSAVGGEDRKGGRESRVGSKKKGKNEIIDAKEKKPEKIEKIADIPSDQRKAIQELVRKKNMALGALLTLSGWEVDDGKLCFVVEYPIYKDKILSPKNIAIINACVTEVIQKRILISCRFERPKDVGEEIEAVFKES